MTQTIEDFAAYIRQRFPEGLTGIIVIGGTRTTYAMTQQTNGTPGRIDDPIHYARFIREGFVKIISMFFELGGQNLIIPALSYQSFYERGAEYASRFAQLVLWAIDDEFQKFYREQGIDPYFPGLEPLLMLSKENEARHLAETLDSFQKAWDYQPERRKLIWEIAPIPPLTYWQASYGMNEAERDAFNAELMSMTDMEQLYQKLFRFYIKASFGVEIPEPHFYFASNRNGDVKLRAQLSLALLPGRNIRMFFTPYPTLFVTRDTLKTVIEDVARGGALRALQKDYEGKVTRELLDTELARIRTLCNDPQSTIGLIRRRVDDDED